jgi:hypothetical protein
MSPLQGSNEFLRNLPGAVPLAIASHAFSVNKEASLAVALTAPAWMSRATLSGSGQGRGSCSIVIRGWSRETRLTPGYSLSRFQREERALPYGRATAALGYWR